LPDEGYHGFILPSDRIEETAMETMAGFAAMARELATRV